MSQESSRSYRIETELQNYESFYDHPWAKGFCGKADAAGLGEEAWNLCEAWKGAASIARVPWLTVELQQSMAHGFQRTEPYPLQLMAAFVARLTSNVNPRLNQEQFTALVATAHNLDIELKDALRQSPVIIDRQQIWEQFLENSEFGISILASQKLAYAAIYYGYEDLVLACFRRLKGVSDYRIGAGFRNDLNSIYGASTAEKVWSDAPVDIGRKVRHAIVHNGARVTRELKTLPHGVEVIDGRLQITASLTRGLFESLKARATLVLEETSARVAQKAKGTTL